MHLKLCQRFLLVAVIALVRVSSKKQENRQPNIVIMLMDDMGWGDLGCYGNQEKETPNIDRLASQGALFTNFYSANPLCSPSRAALMTGRLPIRNGIYTNNHFGRNSVFFPNVTGGLVDEEETIAEILAKLGYRNKIIGKWHIGNTEESFPLNQGFHEFFGANANHFGPHDNVNAPNVEVYRDNKMVGRYFEREFDINLQTGESNLTRFWTNDALEFIEENQNNPFFLYWAADGTHNPLGAHGDFLGTSKRGLYGDVVRELDYGVGQIITKLKELKLHKNTFVFFSSDNGPAGYEGIESGDSGPFKCSKLTTYEGGFRVPGIAWWPSVIPKRQIERGPATLMDIFNTIMDITGGAVSNSSRHLDGQSLWPVLVDENDIKLGKNTVFYYRGDGLFAVRVGDYKAHYWTWNIQKEKLRDVYGDPCRGDYLENFITDTLRDHRRQPVIFHLGRDPRENYPLDPSTREYTRQLAIINEVRESHIASLAGDVRIPQLNVCDKCTMGWSPNGCEEIGMCRTPVDCNPSLCNWFF
ncbi:N-acetylgalactosamine-6-sulfatase [Holothuria leucospilota]|uniref:N-acetylgalactosamine-6-sulfatase n=1 Tax=Holothuria leucospilota TaxID=206669 RepID=A0A9Q1C7R9_HOLLE|nr:N-acetylgalactosamine-6-sulfatase [Holothuria leucospilota]